MHVGRANGRISLTESNERDKCKRSQRPGQRPGPGLGPGPGPGPEPESHMCEPVFYVVVERTSLTCVFNVGPGRGAGAGRFFPCPKLNARFVRNYGRRSGEGCSRAL